MSYTTVQDIVDSNTHYTPLRPKACRVFNISDCEVCGCPQEAVNGSVVTMEEIYLTSLYDLLDELGMVKSEITYNEIAWCEELGAATCNSCWREKHDKQSPSSNHKQKSIP